MKEIRIDNSKQSAVKSGKWKNPGSSFYYKILNSFTIADPKRSEADPDRYDFDFRKVLQEAYLIAPVEKIKNSPYGITPYSQSGCKYPHHVIRNGKLVVSIPGIQAAYARAKQQGIYKGKVKEHIDRHYKEMGLTMSTMTESVDPIQDQIDDNFESIQRYLEESLNISFVHPDVILESTEQVDPQQTIQETFDWMDQILYQSDEEYNASLVGSSLFEETDPLFDLSSTIELNDDDILRFRQIATAEMCPHGRGYNLNILMAKDPNFFGHNRNYKFFRNPSMDEILYESDDEYNRKIDEENELDESDIEEIDFEEKYSAIDATESEWNEFWSLFERGELHKTKSQMINYYNQYLEYIEAIDNSSEDEIANAHQYKEMIDEMRSDPEYDSWMRRMDLDDMLYAEHRLSQLKPISDEEFIDELLKNKAGMLALTDPDDTELIERYQNEIVYLIDCKLNPSVALDKDAINWEYLNLIRYGMNEAVNVDALMRQTSNFIENYCSTEIIHCQDIVLPYLLKSYILYERTSTIPDVKYSYRMGIDVDTGKLVAIKFKLEPDKITKVGNAAGHVEAYLSKHPEERRQYEQLNQKLKQFKQAGNTDAANKIEHQLKEFEDKVEANANNHKFLSKDGKVTTLVDTLKNVITRTGHIDFVSGDNEIVGIIYRDGKAYTMKNGKGKKVRILPAQSEQVEEFLGRMRNYDPALMQKFMIRNPSNYIPRNQDDGQVVSLTAAFADPKVQNLFISFVKQFRYQPEVYEIGKTCGPNKYQSTRVLWNNLLLYRKLGDTPQFRGPILDLEVKSINKFNPKTQKYDIKYTGLGSPEFIKKESYESGNLNTIIDDIKNNIKKYEEGIQEYIVTPNQFNMNLSSYLEADDQSEENDQVEDGDTPPNIDLGDEKIESNEPPTTDTDESESTEEETPSEDEPEENPEEDTSNEAPNIIEPTSLPKAVDAQETDKNGVNRKKLYIAFIEWAKSYNARNTFGSLFDKDVFDVTYPFVPHEMRYFYRLANPILCVLSGKLTFFQVSELRKLNADNPDMKDALIFAATENDYRAFSTRDKRVYLAVDKSDGSGIQFTRALADSFDLYLQNMIGKGDILHGDVDSSTDSGTDRGDHSDENGE